MGQIDNKQQAIQKAKSWSENSDQENFKKNVQFLKQHVVKLDDLNFKPNPWVFSHIPKTGGTSCENYLAQLFLIQDILHINAPDLNHLPEIITHKKKVPRYIAGHHPMHGMLYQLLSNQKLVHLTLLREPIARVISYYNYLKSRQSHTLHASVKEIDINTFLQQPMVELTNGQARRLTGLLHSDQQVSDSFLFEQAKSVIDGCFTLVGVTERLDDFIKLIESRCERIIKRSPPKNPSKHFIKLNDLNNHQLELIHKKNTVDTLLYNYVLDKFSRINI